MPALIETAALPDDPGTTAYQITGCTYADVQAAIHEICDAVVHGEAHFRAPGRVLMPDLRWRSRGFVRSAEHA